MNTFGFKTENLPKIFGLKCVFMTFMIVSMHDLRGYDS